MPQRKRPPPTSSLQLPRAKDAEISPAKLRDYALNPDHEPDGKHKARVFAATLGIKREDWEYLHDQIKRRVREASVSRYAPRGEDAVEYEVIVQIDGLNGKRAPVVTAWLVEDDGAPRLTTTYVDL